MVIIQIPQLTTKRKINYKRYKNKGIVKSESPLSHEINDEGVKEEKLKRSRFMMF